VNKPSHVAFGAVVLLIAATTGACAVAPTQVERICSIKPAELTAAAAKGQVYSIMTKDKRITFVAFSSGLVGCVEGVDDEGIRRIVARYPEIKFSEYYSNVEI
jgi:hypothetical protein